ncbi:MAG: ParB/RepB/Spo0J family partition protein [Clostridiales bacterium]|nr:ParB/RepB/Spo0J family partition protein [Clostridiales bacterium]HCH67203.1 stage 0 sporulation protein J [Clostridiales bacterium]
MKTGLGKGLDSIFIDNTAPSGGNGLVRLSEIQPRKDQPRKNFDLESLQQLADSIAEHGLLQPVVVREALGGYYEIIAGERRWRAAKMAGLSEIPVTILTADDRKASELAIIENVQREDLNPMEEAQAYKKLQEEYGLTQDKVASAVGKSRSAVANTLRLLDLPEEAGALVATGKLSEGHAKVLLGTTYEEDLIKAAKEVAEKGLSVRETEALVKRLNAASAAEEAEETLKDFPVKVNYTKVLEEKAGRMLGRRVSINGRGKTRRLELFYEDREDLENLLKVLCGDRIFEDET